MFAQFKIYIYAVLFVLMLSAAGGAYWYYTWSQSEITTLRNNAAKLENALDLSEQANASLKEDASKITITLTEINKKFEVTRKENNKLKEILSKHDLGYLAANKPKLVEKFINKGTDDAGRCFEILSGAPLTKDELAATKKSQINSICPDAANPNYKVEQ